MSQSGLRDPDLLARVDASAFARFAEMAWNLESGSVHFVSQSANAIFRGEADGRGIYLRLVHEAGSRGIENIAAVQEYQLHLGRQGAPVSRPIPSSHDRLIEHFAQRGDGFLVRAETEVEGEVFAPINVGLDRGDAAFQELGRSLARLHEAALTFRPSTDFERYSWRRELASTDVWLTAEDSAARAELTYIKERLEALEPSGDAYGLTHGDMNCGNIIWDGATATIIDMDEPMWNWFASDIVRPMRDYRTWPLAGRRRILAAIVEGYRTIRPFSDEWVARLSLFQRFKELGMYAWTTVGYSMKPGDSNRAHLDRYLDRQRRYFVEPLEF